MNIKKLGLAALALVAIAGSLFYLFHKPTEQGEKQATDVSEALGMRAAEDVARLIGHPGRVALLEPEIRSGQAPTAVATLDIFRATLKKRGITVARTKTVPGGLSGLVMGRRASRADYVALVEASPAVDAVVTFASLPDFPADELQSYQASHPPLVVVDIFGVLKGQTLPSLVEQKTIALAFAPRTFPEVEQQKSETRTFERYYHRFPPAAK